MRHRVVSGSAALIILALFFFPWAGTPDNPPPRMLTGYELALARPVLWLVLLAAGAALLRLLAAGWYPDWSKTAGWGGAVTASSGLIVLAFTAWSLLSGGGTLAWLSPGFWLTGAALLLLGGTSLISTSSSGQANPPAGLPALAAEEEPYREVSAAAVAPTPSLSDPQPVAAAPETDLIAWLVLREGEQAGDCFRLRQMTSIGREFTNDIVLTDTALSSYHACVRLENGRFVLYDKGSRNGTFVYQPVTGRWQKIDACELQDGTQIKLGRVIFHFMAVSMLDD